jgi:predicted amidohydrolase YtcJ
VTTPGTRILLRGGHVHTPDEAPASALCIEDGTVRWVGDDAGADHFADDADRVVELDGRLVTPAFVDAHVHLSQTGMAANSVDLGDCRTLLEALNALERHTRTSSFPVVLALNWDETRWPENRPFTRAEVDRAVAGRPAYLARVDAHSAVVSSAFIDAFPAVRSLEGYDAGGRVARRANIEAREAVFGLVPASAQRDAVALALDRAARAGIGMVHEMGAPGDSPVEDFERIAELTACSVVPESVWYWGSLDVEQAQRIGAAGAAGDLCADGAVGSRTAALRAPYADDPATCGHLYLEAEQVRDHVVACTRASLQAGFHVIGDRAVDAVVSGLTQAAEVIGAAAVVAGRHRLEHVEMVDLDQMALLGRLGVTASMQPMFDGLWGGTDSLYAQRLGVTRARPMNGFASMARAGVALAFGSDTPVTPFDPWAAVRAAARHHTESERISVRAALEAHTRGGWRAARRDDGGVIGVGAPASIAVWDTGGSVVPSLPDLHPDQDLPTCVLTLVRGRVAFEESGALR